MSLFTFLLLTLVTAMGAYTWRLHRRWQVEEHRRFRELAEQRERQQAAQAEHDARLEAILDGMIEGLVVIDAQNHIVLANRAAEAMFSFSRMMIGGTLLQAIRHHEIATIAARALAESTVMQHELRLESPKPRVLQMSAVALRDAAAAPRGAVLVFHDVTQLHRLEAMRQDFVANVSHELRTPLSLIKSAAETLLDGGKDDPAVTARFLEIIDKHANRLTLLIDDLLLLARLDSDRVQLNLQPLTLRIAAQEALDDAALLARARNVALENQVPEDLLARADPDRLRQVLANLIDNAIKYGRGDGRVAVRGRSVDASFVEISVRDNGPGIPAGAKERVFERFYRVDKARSREQGGTGLGLSIVKNVVQAHGGEVRVESVPGEGTEFFFTLPTAESEG